MQQAEIIFQAQTACPVAEAGLEKIEVTGILSEMPVLKSGYCLVCRFSPGFGLPEKQIVCQGPLHLQLLKERYMKGEIFNVRWYQGARAKFDMTWN